LAAQAKLTHSTRRRWRGSEAALPKKARIRLRSHAMAVNSTHFFPPAIAPQYQVTGG